MTNPNPIGIGMVGYSFMGASHSHAWRSVHRFFDVSLQPEMAAICGRNPEAVEGARRQMGWASAETDWRALLARDDVGLVDICTPGSSHAEIAIAALEAGKHVLCEKPMAATAAECRQMIDACAQADRRLMIGYRVHWEPHNVEAVRMVRAGELGTVRKIVGQHGGGVDPATPHGEWRIQRELAGGGSLFDIGIYSLNGARWLTGEEPVEIRAALRRPPGATVKGRPADVELGIDWSARFPGGVVATCTSAYDHQANRIQVLGEDGSLELSPATSYSGNALRIDRGSTTEERQLGPSEVQFLGMLDEFALAVRERREPRTSGQEGLRDVRLMELIYEAARAGQPVTVPAVP